jgi:hypothetical protein
MVGIRSTAYKSWEMIIGLSAFLYYLGKALFQQMLTGRWIKDKRNLMIFMGTSCSWTEKDPIFKQICQIIKSKVQISTQPQQQAPLPRERLSPSALHVEMCMAQHLSLSAHSCLSPLL